MAARGPRRLGRRAVPRTRSGAIFPRSSFRVPSCAAHALLALALLAACRSDARPRTPFDGAAALGYTKTQLDFGPRIPGSEGHRRTGDWIVARGRATADTVIEQRFTHVTVTGDTLPLRNILSRFRPRESAARAVRHALGFASGLGRPNESRRSDRALPMPGANDGAAGVGLSRRARRGAQAHAAHRRRRPALRGRRGLRQLRRRQGRAARLALLRDAPPRLGVPAALRRALGHDRQEGRALHAGADTRSSARRRWSRSCGSRRRSSATARSSSPAPGIADHRRPRPAARRGAPRDRRDRLRLSGASHDARSRSTRSRSGACRPSATSPTRWWCRRTDRAAPRAGRRRRGMIG